jgi:RsiW-degrading membrane proteinase PrsW (M82 family)
MDSRWARLDSATFKLGDSVVPLRLGIVVVAAVLWLATIALETGAAIAPAAATAIAFLVPLTAISLVSRSLGFRLQLSFFLWGGLIIAIALLSIDVFQVVDPRNDSLRNYVIPFLEETLKLLPLLVFVFLRRRDRAWTVGVMDVLLLAATTGVAFGFVEDAYIRNTSHWSEGFSWLPVTSLVDAKQRLVAGHAIWTGIAGGTIGLALLWRRRPTLAVPLGLVGFLWSWLDHAANNQLATGGRDASSNVVVSVWRVIEGNGFFSVYLFLALVAIAIVADRWALRSAEPLALPGVQPSTGVLDRWRWIRAAVRSPLPRGSCAAIAQTEPQRRSSS